LLQIRIKQAKLNYRAKISGSSAWSRPLIFGFYEHSRLTNGEINSEEFQFPTYVITVHQRHRRTDRQTDRRHAIARPCFALKCIVR